MHVRTDYPTAKELTLALGGRWNDRMQRGNARCPAHDDTDPSLDITERNERVLYVCRAGCSQDAVTAALRQRGCWPERKPAAAEPKRIVAIYDYTDAEGVLRFQSVRYQPKDFRQRRPDGSGGWVWSLPLIPEHRYLPYRLPELAEAVALGKPVLIVEGEKDVETAASVGIVATCNAGGAGKWTLEHARHLQGADAIVVPDNDEPGRRHADDVGESLSGIAKRTRLLALPELPHKGDLTDWVAAGGTSEELWQLVEQAPAWMPQPNRAGRRAASSAIRHLTSVRLSEVAMRHIQWVWPGRIAVGMHSTLAGEPGIGKSTLLYWIAATVTIGGAWPCSEGTAPRGSVIILSAEDAPEYTIKPRVVAAGGDPDKITLVTATMDDDGRVSGFTLARDLRALEEMIDELGDVVLVIIDPITSYLGDADGHSNTDIRGVVEPLHEMAARKGVAVLTNTHFAKSGAANKSRASHRVIGSTAFIALPRVALSVVQDSEDDGRRLVLHLKNNIAPAAPGLAYKIDQRLAGYEDGAPLYASCVVWEAEHVTMTADQAVSEHESKLRDDGKRERPAPARDAAEAFLRELFEGREEETLTTREINAAAREAGISAQPLREARERLCESVIKRGDGGVVEGWLVRLKKGPQL
jgi:hypothetical protein